MAAAVAEEFLGENVICARIITVLCLVFGVRVIEAINARPLWPWIVRGTLGGGLVKQFKIHHTLAAVPQRSANAIRTGIAATDNDHVLVLGRRVRFVIEIGIEQALRVTRKEIHGKLNTS